MNMIFNRSIWNMKYMKYSKDHIPFLDIFVKKDENDILTDLYHQSIGTQRCLLFIPSHRNHGKENIQF